MPEILSPSTEATVSKAQKSSIATPKRRRMANVLDVVLETTKTLSPAPTRKIVKASKAQPKAETKKAEVFKLKPKLGLQCPLRQSLPQLKKRRQSKLRLKWLKLLAPKLQKKALITSFVMLRETDFLKKKS
jgi:hypothetical protein